MLVLSRKAGERIRIGDDICITVVRVAQNGVRLGIEAPAHFTIMREELDDGSMQQGLANIDADRIKPR
ncbi:MAG: carbon storage regulator [Planctomycetales bacterium]|nr:carbon storage regulator [Planctomycetales bacterium]